MNKKSYLENTDVNGFVSYVVDCIKEKKQVNHQYEIVWARWKKYHRENFLSSSSNIWQVNTLREAFEKYYWPPGSYQNNLVEIPNFDNFQDIHEEYKPLYLFHTSVDILSWGNVVSKGSVNWLLKAQKENLLEAYINDAVAVLLGENEEEVLEAFKQGGKFLMNSGTTKIFSFYSKGLSIIYDGRVGASIGLLVKNYLIQNNYEILPEELAFMWGADQGNTGKRNPSDGQFIFPELKSGQKNNSALHALMNLRANWILEAAISECDESDWLMWGANNAGEFMRMVEAALFMLGADVSFKK